MLADFTKETGILVNIATYDSNEAMYAKVKLLQAGGYDLVFPSTYYVNRMRREGLLRAVDKGRERGHARRCAAPQHVLNAKFI